MRSLPERLEAARRDGILVAIERDAFEDAEDLGFVSGVGDALFAIDRVSEAIRLDGTSILRLDDVSDLEDPHEHADFVSTALRMRGEQASGAHRIDLSSWTTVLTALAEADLVVIHEEEDEEGEICRIGAVQAVDDVAVELVEIDPDADWARSASKIELARITRVDVGGAYEEALRLVGGRCPIERTSSEDGA